MCVHGFQGMGYSPDFIVKMGQIVEEMKDQSIDFPIQVVAGLDDVCNFCPNKGDGNCNSPKTDSYVLNLDRKVMDHLGIKSGEIYNKKELISLTTSLINPEDLDYLCEGCSWLTYGVCKDGIAKLKNEILDK